MANEEKRVYHGTTDTLETAGGSCSNGAIVQADNADYDLSARGDYPHLKFTLTTATWSSAPNEMGVIEIIVKSLDVDGTTDTVAPTATYRHQVVGRFIVNNSTAAGTFECLCYNVPRKGTAYLYNDTGQTLAANWVLKAQAFTYAPT